MQSQERVFSGLGGRIDFLFGKKCIIVIPKESVISMCKSYYKIFANKTDSKRTKCKLFILGQYILG